MTILCTQEETDRYLTANVAIGRALTVTFCPREPINLDEWILPHECCGSCGEITPGLRRDEEGHPREDCASCGREGGLITTWGTAQTERWQCGERYDRTTFDGQIEDDGPPIGFIAFNGGDAKHIASLRRQAERAGIRCDHDP